MRRQNQQIPAAAPAASAETPRVTVLEQPKPVFTTLTAFAVRRRGPMWVIQQLDIVNGLVVNLSENQGDTLGMQLARFEKIITKEFR